MEINEFLKHNFGQKVSGIPVRGLIRGQIVSVKWAYKDDPVLGINMPDFSSTNVLIGWSDGTFSYSSICTKPFLNGKGYTFIDPGKNA